jgi:hypothetical protein
MCKQRKAALVLTAAEYLDSIENGQARREPFVVVVKYHDGEEHAVPCRHWPEAGPPRPAPRPHAGWAMFSPLEVRIVEGLAGGAWTTTAALAATIGEEPSSEFRCVLRNLGERGVVETNQRLGVRLTEAGEQPSG